MGIIATVLLVIVFVGRYLKKVFSAKKQKKDIADPGNYHNAILNFLDGEKKKRDGRLYRKGETEWYMRKSDFVEAYLFYKSMPYVDIRRFKISHLGDDVHFSIPVGKDGELVLTDRRWNTCDVASIFFRIAGINRLRIRFFKD
ncbi:hypothetical protein [Bacteroides sp. 14(A)]|uniref:hypothetical protein n=1 Tax=Bacteroides sp. 14(A) TaxID=1163670 RepID=UPI0004785302|nr:hypothetical protein [Bacteroides sp. 14(A)]